jgi:hypothetical protein
LVQGPDGTFIQVGANSGGRLWSNTGVMFNTPWFETASPGEQGINSLAIAPDGTLLVAAGGNIWKKNSYQNLLSQQWQGPQPNTCCIKALTVAPDGTLIAVGTDDQLYTKASYTDLSTPWQGPYSSENTSCCAVSVATVVNPNYNANNYTQGSQPPNMNAAPMVTVNNSAYWGTSGYGQTSGTLQECEATCSATTGCTGATYNSSNSTCYLRGGDSAVVPASDTEVAIIPKGKQLLMVIQNINQQLTDINQQIQNKTTNGQPLYAQQTQQRSSKSSELISQFIKLTEERNKINEMINVYQSLEQQQVQGDITINQNYYSFVLLLFLAVVILVCLFYYGVSNNDLQIQNNSGGLNLSTNYVVIITFLIALLIASIYIVISKTGTDVSGLSKSLIPANLPQIKLSKFGWN